MPVMKKMFAVLRREYVVAVRKKSFIIVTLAMPILMSALMFSSYLIGMKGLGEKKVVVIDATGKLGDALTHLDEPPAPKGELAKAVAKQAERTNPPMGMIVDYVNAAGKNVDEVAKPHLDLLMSGGATEKERVDGVLVVPASAFADSKTSMKYYSRSATDLMAQERLGRTVNNEVQRARLTSHGIKADEIESILDRVPVEGVQLTRTGEQKTGGELNLLVGFVFAALLLIPSLVFGNEVMRGIVQEKTDRIVEVLISSLTPMELLSGKIMGLASVGLTQLAVWMVMGGVFGLTGGGLAATAGFNIFQFLRLDVLIYFALFFILGYLLYVCFYAIAGAVCNTEREAQQFVQPVMLVLMVPWFLMMPIIMNPDSPLSVGLSFFPLFSPITMFARILVSEPHGWEIALSIAITVTTICGLFWMTGKLFRMGILSYGKRPTIPELWKWLKLA
jgi:ABC-2 type transport system permease protein